MLLALIFLIGFMVWIVGWKCRQGSPAKRYGFAIIAVLLGAPTMMILLVLAGAPGLALWYFPAALLLIAIFWREMFRPPSWGLRSKRTRNVCKG